VTYKDRRLRVIDFYPNRNDDHLIKRVEEIGVKTEEWYVNRDDKVTYRAIYFKAKDIHLAGGDSGTH